MIGGAYSVDKFYRLSRHYGWWADEQPSEEIKAYVTKQLATHSVDIILSHTGKKLELEVVVKPDLIGGFIIEVGDHLLDGSVRRQLDIIRRQFVVRNRRIV